MELEEVRTHFWSLPASLKPESWPTVAPYVFFQSHLLTLPASISRSKKEEKKRAGDSATLPEATKKSKTSESPLFGAQSSWGSSSFASSSKPSSSSATSSNSNVSSAPSSSSAPAASKSTAPKSVFGFAAPKPGQTFPARKPAPSPSKPTSSVAASSAPKPILAKPSVESDLPARYVAEGMSVKSALAQVMSKTNSASPTKMSDKPLLVIDCANVSHEHGKGDWSTQGLPIAVKHYQAQGYDVVAFLPDHYLTQHYPDPLQDWTQLEKLAAEKVLIPTPAADYDDLYIVQHARNNHGLIVSNDRYRDVPQCFDDPVERKMAANWINNHKISFTFDGDTFKPRIEVDALVSRLRKHEERS